MRTTSFDNESTPDLVVVVADADAEQFLLATLERGILAGCIRAPLYRILRDPMRDASLRQNPTKALVGIDRSRTRVLVVFDHHGSGREKDSVVPIESDVEAALVKTGFPSESVCCAVFSPELEGLLVPCWPRVEELLKKKRPERAVSRRSVLVKSRLWQQEGEPTDNEWRGLLERHPKECLGGLLQCLNLRHQPALFSELGKSLSLPAIKQVSTATKISRRLESWFGRPAS